MFLPAAFPESIKAIVAEPFNPAPRLVYADKLAEIGMIGAERKQRHYAKLLEERTWELKREGHWRICGCFESGGVIYTVCKDGKILQAHPKPTSATRMSDARNVRRYYNALRERSRSNYLRERR